MKLVPPSSENVVYISLPQKNLIDALEHYLHLAREGRLLSFVGCGRSSQIDELTVAMDGDFHTDIYAHVGALYTIANHLGSLALEEHNPHLAG